MRLLPKYLSKTILIFSISTLLSINSAYSFAIYPLNQASILAGSKFDFKVEYDQMVEESDASIKINGTSAGEFFKTKPEYIQNESGKGSSFIWRNVTLPVAGSYQVLATNASRSITAKNVTWDVYSTGPRKVKNIIFFLGDGLTIANRTSARVLSKGIIEGKYQGRLSFDDMPYMAMIGTSGADSLLTDSANSMSAYMTGHKSSVNALGVYASRASDNLAHPKVETIAELIKRKTKMSVGIVSDAEIEDATPAALVAHTRRRADKQYIADQLFYQNIDVILGGGSAYFLPQSEKLSKRKDNNNLVRLFKNDGYEFVSTRSELLNIDIKPSTKKVLGLFHHDNMDGSYDRFISKKNTVPQYPDQPDLTEMTKTAINVLSKNPNGFFLMVEAGLIDKFNHPLDWERAAYDTIMLSNTVAIAKEYAATHKDTLVVVTPDHTHSGSIIGVIDDARKGSLREKVGTYAEAGFPNYPKANAQGYPESIDVSKRMVFQYSSYPDHYETMRPKLDGSFVPAIKENKDSKKYIANPKYKDQNEDAYLVSGNIPDSGDTGVHTADDGILHAYGPTGEAFKSFLDNTEVFKNLVNALGLGK